MLQRIGLPDTVRLRPGTGVAGQAAGVAGTQELSPPQREPETD